jgi:membrane-associated protease RseP (regulator of RpoE activity)
MKAVCLIAVLSLGSIVSVMPAWAEEPQRVEGQMRVEVRADKGDEAQPQVRVWVNGQEVEPGKAITLGEGGAIRLDALTGKREERSEDRPNAGQAYLGVGLMRVHKEGRPGEPARFEPGALVTEVRPGSPADQVGLQPEDVISAIDGKPVEEPEQLVQRVRDSKPGDVVKLTLYRNGKRMEKTVTLAAWPGQEPAERSERPRPAERSERPRPAAPSERPRQNEPAPAYLGVVAAPLTEEMMEIAGTRRGVLINTLMDGSPAAEAGLLAGDVVTRVDGKEIGAPEDLVQTIRGHRPGDRVRIEYYRTGKRREAEVQLGRHEAGEGGRSSWFGDVPQELGREFPNLRDYLEQLGRSLREGPAGRTPEPPRIEVRPQQPPRIEIRPGAPVPPGAVPERMEPYGVGKDIGQILQRLDRIERRLDAIENRLDRPERR